MTLVFLGISYSFHSQQTAKKLSSINFGTIPHSFCFKVYHQIFICAGVRDEMGRPILGNVMYVFTVYACH